MNYDIIVSGSDDGTIKIWKEGFTPAEHWAHKYKIQCVYISELYILTGSRNIGIWNHDGVCLKILEGHKDMVSSVKFYDGYVISGSYDCSVRVWDIDDGCINILRGHIRPIKNIAIDKHEIISTSEDGKIIVWSR
jgi:WD40 repeat protein